MAIKDYSDIPANNNKSGALFPEGMLAKDLNNNLRIMQADIKKHTDLYWLELDKTITRINDRSFRVQSIDVTGLFHTGRVIRVGSDLCRVVSSTFTSSNTDVTIDKKVFKSVKKVYTLLPSDWVRSVIDIDDGEYCFAEFIYKYKNVYKMCIKNTDNLTQKLWDDRSNFVSIQGDAVTIRDLGFAQLKLTYKDGKLTIEQTTK